jgi:predicted glycogen debranching enzyme
VRISEDEKILVQRDSLLDSRGRHFAVLTPLPTPQKKMRRQMKITVYAEPESRREKAPLLFLPEHEAFIKTEIESPNIASNHMTFLSANGRGGMCRPCIGWGELKSRYDCVLAANLNPEFPEDRHIMLSRVRICTDYHGRRECFSKNCDSFRLGNDGNSGAWAFSVPLGNGFTSRFIVSMRMIQERNQVVINIKRLPKNERDKLLIEDNEPVKILVRPDVEDRNFHQETKAYLGPEKRWPQSISTSTKSFIFNPSGQRRLLMSTSKGVFKKSPEWTYAVFRENESKRGLDPYGDIFCPGFFEIVLTGGEEDIITASINTDVEPVYEPLPPEQTLPPLPSKRLAFEYALLRASEKFIVRREDWKTVIAGYPWFLDWGRDTLIAARGLIRAGKIGEVEKILLLFAKFADKGTLPNMIHGKDASNRDTSDAPLWLFTVLSDFCEFRKSDEILAQSPDNKSSLLDILAGIAENYISGTPNGIKVDPESGLVFSPPHFTWMDTNFPACTPREGYPVEIQALWFAALAFLEAKTGEKKWGVLKTLVSQSIYKYFKIVDPLSGDFQWLSDCLHAGAGCPASKAVADDHLRPNQLLAITLGAVSDFQLKKGILRACSELLVPGAIRSLADRRVKFKLPLKNPKGDLLNNPEYPYFGTYIGGEDSSRKPAYHNGTAWTWLFPSYPEAVVMTYGEAAKSAAKSILHSSSVLMESDCVGNIPEILDGNFPHVQRGCDAQAWGVTELYRVYKLIN